MDHIALLGMELAYWIGVGGLALQTSPGPGDNNLLIGTCRRTRPVMKVAQLPASSLRSPLGIRAIESPVEVSLLMSPAARAVFRGQLRHASVVGPPASGSVSALKIGLAVVESVQAFLGVAAGLPPPDAHLHCVH